VKIIEVQPDSIAVLPFADISQNKDQEYLGDGISDTIMHVLSQVKGLTVTARTSSFAFYDRNPNTGEGPAYAADVVIAKQRIFHGLEYQSRLVLPVIPARAL
jgi:hypothetical protein